MRLWKRFRGSYFLYSFLHDPVAMGSFAILTFLTLAAFGAPVIAPHNPYDTTTINIMDSEIPPVWMEGGEQNFTLGTDAQGRDMLSTMLYGMRISLIIGVGATPAALYNRPGAHVSGGVVMKILGFWKNFL